MVLCGGSYDWRTVDAHVLRRVAVMFGDPLKMVVDTGEGLVCPVCQKKFTRRDNLKSHFSNLHGEHRGPFRCSYCFKVTKNKMSLRAHMKNYHPNEMQRRNSAANNDAVKLDDSPGLAALTEAALGAALNPLPPSLARDAGCDRTPTLQSAMGDSGHFMIT